MLDKIYKNILISLVIIALWTVFVFVVFFKDNTGLGKMFGVSIMYFITRNFALGLGLLMLVLRIFRVMKNNTNLLYIFSMTLNFSIAILAVGLFLFGVINIAVLHVYLLNLIVGFLLLAIIIIRSSFVENAQSNF